MINDEYYDHDHTGKACKSYDHDQHEANSDQSKFVSRSVSSSEGILGAHYYGNHLKVCFQKLYAINLSLNDRSWILLLKDKPTHVHPVYTCHHPSSSSLDIVPDSLVTSNSEYMSDNAFLESDTSGDWRHENHVHCQGHKQQTTLLILPSTTSNSSYDHSHVNAIGMAMM